MNINYIREFLVLSEEENFLQAAETLFISQSTLSRHLQSMEAELRIPLFDRTTRKVKINEYGRLFQRYAREIVRAEDAFLAELSEKLKEFSGELKVGAFPSMPYYGITDTISEFKKDNPSCQLTIIEGESQELRSMLENGSCDLAFVRESSKQSGNFVSLPFTEDKLVAVLPAVHPLADSGEISLAQLRDENFLLLPINTFMHHLCVSACRKAGFEPTIGFISHRSANIIDLVQKNMGVSLLTQKPIIGGLPREVKAVNIIPSVKTYINIIYPKGKKLPLAATLFLNYLGQPK